MRIQIGERVRYSAKYLRSVSDFSKESADRTGVIRGIEDLGKARLAAVEWDDDPGALKRVLASNLWPERKLGLEPS